MTRDAFFDGRGVTDAERRGRGGDREILTTIERRTASKHSKLTLGGGDCER